MKKVDRHRHFYRPPVGIGIFTVNRSGSGNKASPVPLVTD
jgi:hypothetical protein